MSVVQLRALGECALETQSGPVDPSAARPLIPRGGACQRYPMSEAAQSQASGDFRLRASCYL